MSTDGHGPSCVVGCASPCDHSDCGPCKTLKATNARRRLLKTMPNPATDPSYSIVCKTHELTFLGNRDQPDFAILTIAYSPRDVILELKSLKKYVQSFASRLFSYERLLNVIYEELWDVLSDAGPYQNPVRGLVVTIECHPRGGIETTVQRGE